MIVLDASSLLALLADEPGADKVSAALTEGATISAVNLSEVAAKLTDWGIPIDDVREALGGLGLPVEPFSEELAYLGGELRPVTRRAGLSLGDRSCLALALRKGLTVLTADRTWKDLVPEVRVELVRG